MSRKARSLRFRSSMLEFARSSRATKLCFICVQVVMAPSRGFQYLRRLFFVLCGPGNNECDAGHKNPLSRVIGPKCSRQLMALSCRAEWRQPRQLSGVKRTPTVRTVAATNDPFRTFAAGLCCDAQRIIAGAGDVVG